MATQLKCSSGVCDSSDMKPVGYCTECFEYLCEICCKGHRKNKLTKCHEILQDDKLPRNPNVPQQFKEAISCSNHPDISVSHQCLEHGQYICVDCVLESHKKCNDVVEILSSSNGYCHKTSTMQIKEKIMALKKKTANVMNENEMHVSRVIREQQQMAKERKRFIEKLHEKLESLNTKAEEEIAKLVELEKFSFCQSLYRCHELETEYDNNLEILEHAASSCREHLLPIITSSINRKIQVSEDTLLAESNKQYKHFSFKPNATLLSEDSLGDVEVLVSSETDVGSDCVGSDEINEIADDTSTNLPLLKRRVVFDGNHSAKDVNDKKTCSLISSAMMADNRLVIIDNANNNIKVFNKNLTLLFTQSVEDSLLGCCRIGTDMIAVIYSNRMSVDIYFVRQNSLQKNKSYNMVLYPLAIAKIGEELAILAADKPYGKSIDSRINNVTITIIRVQDLAVVNTIEKFHSFRQNYFIKDPRCLGIVKHQKLIIGEINRLEMSFKDGNIPFWYKSALLKDISNVATDSAGNIYACGLQSNNVHQISSKDYTVNRILVQNIRRPRCITFDNFKCRIIIGCENDDQIHVYKFQ